MAGSHVPKFGNWDDDNVPYTTYFENARKERASVIRNPNDPEENPGAFMHMRGKLESDGDPSLFQIPHPVNSNKPISSRPRYAEGHRRHNAHLRQGHRSMSSEFGNEKTTSEHSLAGHQYANSDKRRGRAEGKNSFSVSVSGHSRLRNKSYASDDNKHHRSPSVPKFGAWDEADPKSGDGFTAIFNKVREEKQSPSSLFPVVHPQPNNFLDGHSKHRSSSLDSKICCCIFSRKRN
ncbi:hypothetical protein SLE2022_291590 [Rubroshorea leprosula]